MTQEPFTKREQICMYAKELISMIPLSYDIESDAHFNELVCNGLEKFSTVLDLGYSRIQCEELVAQIRQFIGETHKKMDKAMGDHNADTFVHRR